MKTKKAHSRQSLWDLAIQHCGSADAVFEIARLNGLLPTAKPSEGIDYTMPEHDNRKVAKYYAEHGEVPATWPNQSCAFAWSNPICELDAIYSTFSWSDPICVLSEPPYMFAWGSGICSMDAGLFTHVWSDPICAEKQDNYVFAWTNPICATEDHYVSRWINSICTKTIGNYSSRWTNGVCAREYHYTLEWEELRSTKNKHKKHKSHGIPKHRLRA